MYVEWTKHIKDPDKKEKWIKEVYSCKTVLDHIKKIIEEKENILDRSERSIQVYDSPSWDYRQAHKNGNKESLVWLKSFIDLDQQKEK